MDQDLVAPGIQQLNYFAIDGTYPTAAAAFMKGGAGRYTMVDNSAWELSSTCGSCHPGGGFVEKDRDGTRFSMLNPMTAMNPYTYYVFDRYDQFTGMPKHTVEPSPWAYPIWQGETPLTAPGGWGNAMTMTLPDGSAMPIVDDQVMMPNVKEFDCLMCHFDGFNNLMSSVMAYSGAHNATPSFGAGFMNMFTEAYDFTTGLLEKGAGNTVWLAPAGLANLKADPPTQNCRNCHMGSGLKDLPDMMRDFLSSAPMAYTGSFAKSFTGQAMPAFDFNAPFGMSWDWKVQFMTTPTLFMTQTGIGSMTPGFTTTIPAGWPSAMGMSKYNGAAFANFSTAMPGMKQYFLGGGNPMQTGPIYYQAAAKASAANVAAYPSLELGKIIYMSNSGTPTTDPVQAMVVNGFKVEMQDQMALKKGYVPFPRAEWFKRGDSWEQSKDVHYSFDCSGCHMNTGTTKVDTATFDGKSLCDPGRGFDSAGGVESNPAKRFTTNSQNTVKRCANCHVPNAAGEFVNNDGDPINNFAAPNPTAKHLAFGLASSATKVTALKMGASGEESFLGTHLDVIDCTVCHIYRKQMAVRLLDCTSGNRYPNMVGFKEELGMMGMFSDPFGDATPMINPMFPRNDNEKEWFPLYSWEKVGDDFKTLADGTTPNPNWRRKIYAINSIVAGLWNNVNPTVDANGDGVAGRAPSTHGTNVEYMATANYDPWISRDMKAGLNFGPSGFAPIPVGFGNSTYQSAYAPDGKFTGAFTYVGVYGGNIMFSTPEEIAAYKAYRTAIKDYPGMDGKSWAGTQLSLLGGPYKLTHGIRRTGQFVLGTSCADCHSTAPKAPIFAGGFDMLGTAIKATAGGDFMQSPAEQYQVVALPADLVTGAELARKDGQLGEVEFEEMGCWNSATKTFGNYSSGTTCATGTIEAKKAVELDRSKALYPMNTAYTAADGTVYADRAEWVAYLTGIAKAPTAAIVTVSGSTPAGTNAVQIDTGAVTFSAQGTEDPNLEYSWKFSNSAETFKTFSVERTITAPVNFTATMFVKNPTTGQIAVTKTLIKVKQTFANGTTTAIPAKVAGTTRKVALAVRNMATPITKIQILWGDGTSSSYKTTSTGYNASHTYYGAASTFAGRVKVINGASVKDVEGFYVDFDAF